MNLIHQNLHKFFSSLLELNLSAATIREILQAQANQKVSRTLLTEHQLLKMIPIFESFSMCFCISEEKYLTLEDQNKGGFSNKFGISVPVEVEEGYFLVYFGNNLQSVYHAKFCEEAGLDNHFGEYLNIPLCCRDFYAQFHKKANMYQNDLSPFTAVNTIDLRSTNPWSSHLSQYFGFSLFSYFPCSFNCQITAEKAKESYQFLAQIDLDFAKKFYEYQHKNYLYTEWDGIFCFHESTYNKSDDIFYYNPRKLETGAKGLLFNVLSTANRIYSKQDQLIISKDNNQLLTISKYDHFLLIVNG